MTASECAFCITKGRTASAKIPTEH